MFDDADYADWIGRSFAREDAVTPRLIEGARAALGPWLAEAEVPTGLFWMLAPDAVAADALGPDGHVRTGRFLPALPLPRRMWAGGELRLSDDLRPGDRVVRTSVIGKVTGKTGASGPLGFVTLENRYETAEGRPILEERQDIVYRGAAVPGAPAPALPPAPDLGAPVMAFTLTPDPVLLFRFSALTFNGHRIHYDFPYATGEEGYAGLVVHGPMQALLMLNLAQRAMGRRPARFSYRGVSPLIAGQEIAVEAHPGREGALDLRVRVAGGAVTMMAQAWA